MSGERGRRVEFGYLFLPLPLLVSSVPFPTLAVLDCERTNVRPQSNYPRHLPTRPKQPPCFLPLLYTNVTIFSQDPLVLINPPQINTTYLYLFSFLAHFWPVFYQTLRPTTLYYPRPTYLCAFLSTFTFRFFILFEAELPILFYLLLFTSTSASTLCELQCRNNVGWLVEIWFDF